jgi:branched-chain amino acid transport system substrate-binding protein
MHTSREGPARLSKRTGRRRRGRVVLAALAFTILATVVSACGSDSDSGGSDGGTIVLGMETSLSGSDAAFGEANRDGAELAIDQKNADGGLLEGQDVELQAEDDEARPEVAASICKKFSTEAAVVLTAFSYTSIPCAEVLEGKKPQVTILATSHTLTEEGNEWIFRIAVPDTHLAADVMDYINEQGWSRIAILHANDDFGNGGADSLKASAEELGLDVVAEETYVAGDREFSAQLGSVADADPDVVLDWGNYAEAAAVAKQRGDFGLADVPYIESDAVATPEYVKLGGDATTGVIYATHWSPTFDSPTNEAFLADFEEQFGHPPDLFSAEAYTAALVSMNAIEEAGSTDAQAVRDELAATDLDTPMGQIQFDENGDPNYSTFLVEILGPGEEKVLVGR